MKVVIVDHSHEDCSTEVGILKAAGYDVAVTQVHDEDDVIDALKDADAAIAEYGQFTSKVFKALPNLKIVSNYAMGVDNIDIEAAKAAGLAIANSPDYCFDEVAEHGMTLIVALLRNVVDYAVDVKNHIWDWSKAPKLQRINGLTLGLIGCGQIPRRVARMAHGFGMTVVGYDPFLPKEVAEAAGIELVTMEELGARADAVLSHVPLAKGTKEMVNKSVFDSFKKHPVFVNTSRGLTVDEHELCNALRDGRISRAGLDVIVSETPDFTEEIFSAPNVFFTPHAAFYSETALDEANRTAANNVVEFFAGNYDKVRFVVKPQ
ncbi:D-3-phosphoglycerate dehydrogenase [Oscillibacter sp. PC13]|uniref:C-terminal binding protein n=1 Tax=Oscillibacter sp. PC13 TaxID=1855299 RepID=UPI0008EB64F6|nr:C-terminal binding protein [Oscillibacter sp. PC13]SFQ20280.1 D-3-phosphoglycerate dehydrogenase [Oscillibacter sp. PC13]